MMLWGCLRRLVCGVVSFFFLLFPMYLGYGMVLYLSMIAMVAMVAIVAMMATWLRALGSFG